MIYWFTFSADYDIIILIILSKSWDSMSEEMNITEQTEETVEIALTRSEQREQAFMFLFSKLFGDTPLEDAVEDNSQMFMGGVCAYAQAVAMGIESKTDELDSIIVKYLKKGWSISRISKASLVILRLALYEIKYLENVPDSVAVNEAVELAKKYTIDESGFVNGILGSYIREQGTDK